MDTNRMKLGLAHIFTVNESISKQTKLQLINFIEQANIHQLKVLAMDGQLVPKSQLDENANQIIDDRYDSLDIDEIIKKASVEGITKLVKALNSK